MLNRFSSKTSTLKLIGKYEISLLFFLPRKTEGGLFFACNSWERPVPPEENVNSVEQLERHAALQVTPSCKFES